MMKRITVLLLLFSSLFLSDCFAQAEISLYTTYELPLDELKWIYRPAANYQLGISSTDKYKHKRMSWGGSLGYSNFIPKEEEFYYSVNKDEFGTIQYTNYQVFQLALALRWDYIFNRMELFWGGDIGYQYVFYEYQSADPYQLQDATNIIGRIMLAPKVGTAFLLTDQVSVFFQVRYNCSIATAFENEKDLLNHFIAPGMGLNFRF